MITMRKVMDSDLEAVKKLLGQVLEIHAGIRPDLFKHGTRKYTDEELLVIFHDEDRPVFVGVDEDGRVLGYAFCIRQKPSFTTTMVPRDTLYIDDICVDENARGRHVGQTIFEYVKNYAIEKGYYNMTLHVWEGNDNARAFYEKCGFGYQSYTMEMILE